MSKHKITITYEVIIDTNDNSVDYGEESAPIMIMETDLKFARDDPFYFIEQDFGLKTVTVNGELLE